MTMDISSGEIPQPKESVNRGVDVCLISLDKLKHATKKMDDLQFAIEFKGWTILNLIQFREASQFDGLLVEVLRALKELAAEVAAAGGLLAAGARALDEVKAVTLRLQQFARDAFQEGHHTLTARSRQIRAVGLSLANTVLAVSDVARAEPPALLLAIKKAIGDLDQARGQPMPLEHRSFTPFRTVTSLRDVEHVLTELKRDRPPPKVLVRGAILSEAREMYDLLMKHQLVGGWDIDKPEMPLGWDIYTPFSVDKLRRAATIDSGLAKLSEATTCRMCATASVFGDYQYIPVQPYGMIRDTCDEVVQMLRAEGDADFHPLEFVKLAKIVEDMAELFYLPRYQTVEELVEEIRALIAYTRNSPVLFTAEG